MGCGSAILAIETVTQAATFPFARARIADQWTEVLHNLVSNAVKFTAKGQVRIAATREGERLRIAVSDTGPGIAPDVLPHLFEKFHQADASTTAASAALAWASPSAASSSA